MNKDLQECGANFIKSGAEWLKTRQIQMNISGVVSQLNLCVPVLEKYAKLKKQIAAKRYYPALKTLNELENDYLPPILDYRFSMQIYDMIPK